jgi:exodeoxyribonuclease VII small subunit
VGRSRWSLVVQWRESAVRRGLRKKDVSIMAKEKEPSFEEALAELDAIVHELEDGQLGLEKSLVRYERGVKLLRQCHQLLEGAQRKIELLSGVDDQGNPITRPLADASGASLDEKARGRSRRRSATSANATEGATDSSEDGNAVDEPPWVG